MKMPNCDLLLCPPLLRMNSENFLPVSSLDTNKALKDTCARVGGDPARKLSPADRLIGSSLLVQKNGAVPAYIALGAAAGLYRFVAESEMEQSLENAGSLLLQTAALNRDSTLADMILGYYQMILEGCDLSRLYHRAEQKKAAMKAPII